MLAFQKYGKKYINRTLGYLIMSGTFALMGWVGCIIIVGGNGFGALFESKFATNLLLQSTASFVFLLYISKIFKAYMQQQLFSQYTLRLVTSLARLIMLYSIVIQPGFYFFVDYYAAQNEGKEFIEVGVITYLSHINIVGFAAGYGLHLISTVHKIARSLEEEQQLTI